MKKAILAAATAITFVGCDQITNTEKQNANPATTATFWKNHADMISEETDSLKVKAPLQEALKGKLVVKVDRQEATDNYTKETTAVTFGSDVLAVRNQSAFWFTKTDSTGATRTDTIFEDTRTFYYDEKRIIVRDSTTNITPDTGNKERNRTATKLRINTL